MTPTELRLTLLAKGYTPLPLRGKIPEGTGWQNRTTNENEIKLWSSLYQYATNTGVLCKQTPFLDLDILNPEAADAAEALVREKFDDGSPILTRFGKPPKRAIPFQTKTPFKKIVVNLISPNGEMEKIEFLADGQQCAVAGEHPETRKNYSWQHGGLAAWPRDQLPEITEERARDLVNAIAGHLIARYGYKLKEPPRQAPFAEQAQAREGGRERSEHHEANWKAYLDNLADHDNNTALAEALIASGMHPGAARNLMRQIIEELPEQDREAHDRKARRLHELDSQINSAIRKIGTREQAPEPGLPPHYDIRPWALREPPMPQWAVPDIIPLKQVTLFSGEGGGGKSTLGLHLAAATTLGRGWLNWVPNQGPAFFIDAEDDIDIIEWRIDAVCKLYNTSPEELYNNGLHIWPLVENAALTAVDKNKGSIIPTKLYTDLLARAAEVKPKIIVIASSANVFTGNENDRPQVTAFINMLRAMAIAGNGSVILISHPSVSGQNSGTYTSGSTQWHNAVRARMALHGLKPKKDDEEDAQDNSGIRVLEFFKNQYGKVADSLMLEWRDRLYLPKPGETDFAKAAREALIDDLWLTFLQRCEAAGRHVCTRKRAHNYAPRLAAAQREAKAAHVAIADLEAAMERAFTAGTAKVQPYGPPSDRTEKIVPA
jgi:RecA-family ATPase